jgi:hypothetical protein
MLIRLERVTLAQQRGEAQLLNKARIHVTLAVNGLLKARQTRKSKALLAPGPLLRSEEIWSISWRQQQATYEFANRTSYQGILRQIFRSPRVSSKLPTSSLLGQATYASSLPRNPSPNFSISRRQ